jgi:hypothetical protein
VSASNYRLAAVEEAWVNATEACGLWAGTTYNIYRDTALCGPHRIIKTGISLIELHTCLRAKLASWDLDGEVSCQGWSGSGGLAVTRPSFVP